MLRQVYVLDSSLGSKDQRVPITGSGHISPHEYGHGAPHIAIMINAFLVFNGQGQPRLTKFYTQLVRNLTSLPLRSAPPTLTPTLPPDTCRP